MTNHPQVDLDARELDRLAADMTDRLEWVSVFPETGIGGSMPWRCVDIVEGQEAGDDPTQPWRELVLRSQRRSYRQEPPPHVAAAFVMQWYLDVVSAAAAFGVAAGEHVLDVSPSALSFDLADGSYFPAAFAIVGTGATHVPDVTERRDLAHAAYREHALRFVHSYAPGVRFSSRQREGMVEDLWLGAWTKAAQRLPITAHPQRWRTSCCFIFALPGGVECASCPRLRPRGEPGGV